MKTKEMIKILFPKTPSNSIDEICMYLAEYGEKFGLGTDLRVGHFLAQVREEVGPEFKAISENLNYSESALPKLFSKFSVIEARAYGRNSEHPANQEMIANIAYANRLGNGGVASGDGWKYRGFGCLQITGKSNFEEVQKRIDKYAPDCGVDIINKKSDTSLKDCLFVGMGFWVWKDLYRLADKGKGSGVVDTITAVINKYTESYEARAKHFESITHLI